MAHPPTNTYVFDPEDATEMARLIQLDKVFTQGMGGALTGLPSLLETAQVLDIGCGPGGWVLNVARTHPEMEVTGIDVSKTMIAYAYARARTQKLTNASFDVMSMLEPLEFGDSSFDLVNARLLVAVLQREQWPKVIEECYRITKPGGIIRLTEIDFMGLTSSFAFEELNHKSYQAGKVLGYGFSPDGRSLGMTYMLRTFLRNIGCENIQQKMHAIDFSSYSDAWADIFHNYEIAFKALQPLIIKGGAGDQEELDHLYQQFLMETHREDFRGVWPYMSVWGTKPLTIKSSE